MRLITVFIGVMIAITMTVIFVAPANCQASSPYIQGESVRYGWEIDVIGSKGTFQASGEIWDIEFINKAEGMGSYSYDMTFWSRRSDNFILVDVFANETGRSFWICYYNYKDNTYKRDLFNGNYDDISGIENDPTFIEGYVPSGPIPSYQGQDFYISSSYSHITSRGGTVSYEELELEVYPIHNLIISPEWSEFWCIGIDRASQHTYLLVFFTLPSQTWVLDLWSGEVTYLPLGQATITDQTVNIMYNINLEG